ncbi:hypothetical protein JTB14_021024 [Gonioctena quinquepunctata]|nr:hypothetical protein JTB14_021024 [Gonioctena quinquepunctata]
MASKRKRVVLSLADKLKIIEHLDKGVTGKKLSEIYGVGKATISDIKNKSYDPEFVYNADETGLVWKALPKTTLASKRESSAPGHKENQEIQEHLKRKKLPLFYKSQPKAWMTAALFTEWYDEVFIPEVKSTKIGGKRRQ